MSTTTTALPAKRRLARNIGKGYELLLGKNTSDGSEAWGVVTDMLHVTAPLAFVAFTVEYDGQSVKLPAVESGAALMSRRSAS